MKTDVTTSIDDGDRDQQWVKRRGKKKKNPLCAIYSSGSHLQNKLNCQDETFTATAGKDTSCSAPAIPQTTQHLLPIYLTQLCSWTSQNNKVPKWMIDTSWQEVLLMSLWRFIFLRFNKCGDTLQTQRGCFQFLHVFVKVHVWSSAVHVA